MKFSEELLFADDDDGLAGCFNFTTSSSPKMLCFGTDTPILENCSVQTPQPKTQKSELTCSGDSQSACSISNISKPNNTNKKRNGAEKESVEKPKTGNQRNCKKTKLKKRNGAEKESVEKTKTGNQRNCKKTKLVENSNVTTHAKVKKEKLGERITALHNNLYLPLARQTQHQCYMKRWDISGFCTIRFTSCVLLTCSASARASLPPYVRAEKVGKGKHRE